MNTNSSSRDLNGLRLFKFIHLLNSHSCQQHNQKRVDQIIASMNYLCPLQVIHYEGRTLLFRAFNPSKKLFAVTVKQEGVQVQLLCGFNILWIIVDK